VSWANNFTDDLRFGADTDHLVGTSRTTGVVVTGSRLR
jgi:hypothetical protein